MKSFLNKILPFFLLGVVIIIFAFGIMLLVYLFIFGAIIGFVLYLFHWIKDKYFSRKSHKQHLNKPRAGRVIDSDHWKEL